MRQWPESWSESMIAGHVFVSPSYLHCLSVDQTPEALIRQECSTHIIYAELFSYRKLKHKYCDDQLAPLDQASSKTPDSCFELSICVHLDGT